MRSCGYKRLELLFKLIIIYIFFNVYDTHQSWSQAFDKLPKTNWFRFYLRMRWDKRLHESFSYELFIICFQNDFKIFLICLGIRVPIHVMTVDWISLLSEEWVESGSWRTSRFSFGNSTTVPVNCTNV